jgi:hypothetical protein
MRLVLAMVLAGLVGLPLSASAQDAEESPVQSLEEPASPPEPAPEEPALQLKLDDAGVEVAPSPPQTFGGYTLEELELRKRRAAFGLIAPAALIIAGVPLIVVGTTGDCHDDFHSLYSRDACRRPRIAGGVLTAVGGLGMIVGSWLVAQRANELPQVSKDYTLEELELRVWRTKIGLGVSTCASVLGVALLLAGTLAADCWEWDAPTKCDVLPIVGGTLFVGGLVGVVVSSVLNAQAQRRKREHYGTQRRAQWDLARSRLVF